MAKRSKRRKVDFSKNEMAKLSGCKSDKAFDYRMKNLSECYGINFSTLKSDSIKGGESYYPAECGELIALLARCYKENPISKQGNASENTTGKEIKEYYQKIYKEIDSLPEEFKDMIYMLPSHFVSKRVEIWIERLINIFVDFILHYITQENEDIGALLQRLSVDIDKANYRMFVNYYMCNYYMCNFLGKEFKSQERIQNASIDFEIAKQINKLLEKANDNKQQNIHFEDESRNRETYYKDIISQYIVSDVVVRNKFIMEKYKEGTTNWKTIKEHICNGDRISEVPIELYPVDEQIVKLEQFVQSGQEKLTRIKERIKELKEFSEEKKQSLNEKNDEFLKNINNAYIKKCKENSNKKTTLYDATDKFIGHILWEFLNNTKK